MCVTLNAKGMGISGEREFTISNATERPSERWKTPSNSFNIDISDDISKNHFGEILVSESNLEWAEQCLRSKDIILGSLAMKVNGEANMEIDQM